MNRSMAQTLPARRIQHVGWLQLVVAALLIAVVAIGVRAAVVQSTPKTTGPTISVNRDYVPKPHGPNQTPKTASIQAVRPASGGTT